MHRLTLTAIFIVLVLATAPGCAKKVPAPRIPAMKYGQRAPLAEEMPVAEGAMMLKEVPEGIPTPSHIK